MPARQRIIPVRREYNRWVANQTLEDYALRFTAKSARKFSSSRISQTAIGAISFLALEAIGGTITIAYGTTNAFFAIIVAAILMLLVGIPISKYAIRHGVEPSAEGGAVDVFHVEQLVVPGLDAERCIVWLRAATSA